MVPLAPVVVLTQVLLDAPVLLRMVLLFALVLPRVALPVLVVALTLGRLDYENVAWALKQMGAGGSERLLPGRAGAGAMLASAGAEGVWGE